jgi:hypothetical protein
MRATIDFFLPMGKNSSLQPTESGDEIFAPPPPIEGAKPIVFPLNYNGGN